MESSRSMRQAWTAVIAGTSVNLCLGILYAWSMWKTELVSAEKAGTPMSGLNEGWTYLNAGEGNWAFSLCGFIFALTMIPGGRLQDRYGPRLGTALGGVLLAGGCILAGVMHSFVGLVVGFGVLGGLGMGFGYAAATPAAVKWFGPARRGLVVGIVVAGYGAAMIYISPLAGKLIAQYGVSGSFIGLGILFSAVILTAAFFLKPPPPDYVAPLANNVAQPVAARQWTAGEMLRSPQFYALFLMYLGSAQVGLLVIGNIKPLFNELAADAPELKSEWWMVFTFLGVINALGRVGTGVYSDKTGRRNAYLINAIPAVAAILLLHWTIETRNTLAFFAAVGVIAWQYGGGLSILPAITADFFGTKNMGLNYGLVFLGWGAAFFVPQVATIMKDGPATLSHAAIWLSAGLSALGILVAVFLKKPAESPS
ncbi:MAG: OFA family MFS transporter [Pirellulales bacterium]